MTFLTEEATGSATAVTRLDRGRVRHLKHFHFAAKKVCRIGRDVPRTRGWTATRTINFASTVRHKSPRCLAFLGERLNFVLRNDCIHFEMFKERKKKGERQKLVTQNVMRDLRGKRTRKGFCRWTCDGQLTDPNSNVRSPFRGGHCERRLR